MMASTKVDRAWDPAFLENENMKEGHKEVPQA